MALLRCPAAAAHAAAAAAAAATPKKVPALLRLRGASGSGFGRRALRVWKLTRQLPAWTRWPWPLPRHRRRRSSARARPRRRHSRRSSSMLRRARPTAWLLRASRRRRRRMRRRPRALTRRRRWRLLAQLRWQLRPRLRRPRRRPRPCLHGRRPTCSMRPCGRASSPAPQLPQRQPWTQRGRVAFPGAAQIEGPPSVVIAFFNFDKAGKLGCCALSFAAFFVAV